MQLQPDVHVEGKGWVSKGYYGLDQGPIIMMIENYRTGLIWRLMRRSLSSSTAAAGRFRGGWLGIWICVYPRHLRLIFNRVVRQAGFRLVPTLFGICAPRLSRAKSFHHFQCAASRLRVDQPPALFS